jgi:biopolymer transport protein ExbD
MYLQITPLADVLVIMLAFLLKTLSVGSTNISAPQDIQLPEAKSEDKVVESVKVDISKDQILFDDKPVTKLVAFQPEPNDMEADGTLRSLNSALLEFDQRAPASTTPPSANGEVAVQPISVAADADAPYATVRTVVRTLSRRGHADLKLMVVQED